MCWNAVNRKKPPTSIFNSLDELFRLAGLRLPFNLQDDNENLFFKYGSVTNHIYVKLLQPLSDNAPPDRQKWRWGKYLWRMIKLRSYFWQNGFFSFDTLGIYSKAIVKANVLPYPISSIFFIFAQAWTSVNFI